MVFFTCGGCGESLKKNRVEKHIRGPCRRNSPVLTCVDCLKEFPAESYAGHVSCMSEAERYGGKGWQPKASANKGLKKQTAWVDGLKAFVEESPSIDPDVRAVVDLIIGHDNVPQKRPKFLNFAKNVCGRRFAPATLEKTWETIEAACKRRPQSAAADSSAENESQASGSVSDAIVEVTADEDNAIEASNGNSKKAKKSSKNGKNKEKSKDDDEEEDEKENGSGPQQVNRGLPMFSGTASVSASSESESKKASKEDQPEKGFGKKARKAKAEAAALSKAKKVKQTKGRFDFEGIVMELLKKKNKGNEPVKLNRIKKKVAAAYLNDTTLPLKSELEVALKLEKHLSKNKKFLLMKDSVKLAK